MAAVFAKIFGRATGIPNLLRGGLQGGKGAGANRSSNFPGIPGLSGNLANRRQVSTTTAPRSPFSSKIENGLNIGSQANDLMQTGVQASGGSSSSAQAAEGGGEKPDNPLKSLVKAFVPSPILGAIEGGKNGGLPGVAAGFAKGAIELSENPAKNMGGPLGFLMKALGR